VAASTLRLGGSNGDVASIRCELLKSQFNGSPFCSQLTLRLPQSERDLEAVCSSAIISPSKMSSIAGNCGHWAPIAVQRSRLHPAPTPCDPIKLVRKVCVETTMLTSVLRRIRFPMLVLAVTASTWSSCHAVGSFQTRPPFPSAVRADDPPLAPTITWPNASVGVLVGGCGKGRVSDPQTRGCRGPADIRSIAR
jgi:hypothetical protein